MTVGSRQVNINRAGGGNYQTLKDFMDSRKVHPVPLVDAQEVAVTSAQYALIDSSILAGTIAKGTTSTDDGGVMAAPLGGAVGGAATTNIVDAFGTVLNKVSIRNESTHDPVTIDIGGGDLLEIIDLDRGPLEAPVPAGPGRPLHCPDAHLAAVHL